MPQKYKAIDFVTLFGHTIVNPVLICAKINTLALISKGLGDGLD